MKKLILSSMVVMALSAALSADVWNKCTACHGQTGEKKALGKSKVINELTKADIVTALNGYKDGTYGGAMKGVMKGQVSSLTQADIQYIAEKIGK